MTVVTGFDYLSEFIIIADTRVSWLNQRQPPQDRLRKLYLLRAGERWFILGFAGNLYAARLILEYFWAKYQSSNLRRQLVVAKLKDAFGRWIEEAAKKRLTVEQRSSVEFLLCGIDPSVQIPQILRDGLVRSTATPGGHLYIYKFTKSGRLSMSRNLGFGIIGSGDRLWREVQHAFQDNIQFGFNQPNLYAARAFIVSTIVSSLYQQSAVSDTVGGLYQVIRLSSPYHCEEY